MTVGLLLMLMLASLWGCGTGGFEGSDNTSSSSPAANALLKRVAGVASKGPLRGGTVAFYALNSNGSVGPLLKKTGTDAFGRYSSSVNITGPTLLSATGSYLDEATGADATIAADSPLRAAVDTLSSAMTIAITPLTELAVRKTAPLLVGGSITAANKLVSDLFKVDILATQPLAPTLEDFSYVGISQEQKDYTLALAAISQMAHDDYGGSLSALMDALTSDLALGTTLSPATSGRFASALTTYLQSDQNHTGVRDVSATNLVNAGGGTLSIKLATSGTLAPGASIYGITVTLVLPVLATVRVSDFSLHQADGRAVFASGAFNSATYTMARFTPGTALAPPSLKVSVPQASPSGLGEFLTVVCDVPPGSAYTSKDFSIDGIKVVGADGNELTVTVILP